MLPLITDNQQLAAYCAAAAKRSILAVDTEFIRQSTLQPKLGLVQLFDGEALALVDPLQISDWQPLQQLLALPGVTKLLHACSEDLDAFATIGIKVINPIFDSQMAAELLGWGNSMGYARLVEQLLEEQLDKSESRTDWLARPLAETQLQYAANDVRFLYQLYPKLLSAFTKPELVQLLLAEGQQLLQRKLQPLLAEFKYLDIKNSWQLSARELAVLRELTCWRLQYAEQKDLALGLIIKDMQLLELAKRRPASAESLLNIPGMAMRDIRRHAKTLVELIAHAKALPQEQCPQPFYHIAAFAGEKVELAKLVEAVKAAAAEHGIAASFMSTKRLMHEYFNWCWRVSDTERPLLPIPEYLQGWRKQLLLPHLPVPEHVSMLVNQL